MRFSRCLLPAALLLAISWTAGCGRSANPDTSSAHATAKTVVLYCAVDREIAQDLIDEFVKETGVRVECKFDTEAAKAVGLVQAVRQEKSHPLCDVFWGGGPFFCTMLANDGCLAPVPHDLVAAEGNAPHDPDGRWLGFAAAYRVLIVNTNVLPANMWPHSILDLTNAQFKGHIGIANPLFGGMAAHVAALFTKLGESGARDWLRGLKQNDCAICAGMADVKNRVASGELWFGMTAADDSHVALEGGKPVTVVFPDQKPGGLGCLDGSSAIGLITGAPHPDEALRLIRFLVTTKTEKTLAAGPGQSVGLLPESVKEDVRPSWIPPHLHTMDVDWSAAVKAQPTATKAIKEILLGS